MRHSTIIFVLLALALFIIDANAGNKRIKAIDGVVIAHSYKETGTYLGSPSICILPSGDYLICHDEFGKGKKSFDGNPVYLSKDKGKSWKLLSVVNGGARWAKIFVWRGQTYLIGPSRKGGGIALFRSEDNGHTWSEPVVLFKDKMFHTAPVPVVEHKGRIWKGFEVIDKSLPRPWPKQYCAAVVSAPVDSELMAPDSWTLSGYVKPDFGALDGKMEGWLEGNAVPGVDGKMQLLMRVELPEGCPDEYLALLDVSEDGETLKFNPETDFYTMPGASKKFTIRYDAVTETYLTLSNEVVNLPKDKRPAMARNVLSLCCSENLKEWTVLKQMIVSDDMEFTGFQYVDWQIDGKDIVFVVRTSYYDDRGGAHSHHDSNYITFHRLKNYRKYVNHPDYE